MAKSTRPTIYNHIPDACLFVSGGLAFVIADIYPASKTIPHFFIGIGWIMILIGIVLVIETMLQMRKHKTSTNPIDEPSSLITNGVFMLSRNPLYVGYVAIVLGCAFVSASYISLLMPLLCILLINYAIVSIEESVLIEKFGDAYKKYKHEVPRWL